ncbi:MAG: MobC family plasmid mobilization relaxosome protein [Lentilitoribacter sp.]
MIQKAKFAGLPFADLMREALGLADSRRRKPMPCVDPEFIRSVSRIGSNVNQIARWLNSTTSAGHFKDIDAVLVASRLVAVDRSLNELIKIIASSSSKAGDTSC